jgi:hypothetical protein
VQLSGLRSRGRLLALASSAVAVLVAVAVVGCGGPGTEADGSSSPESPASTTSAPATSTAPVDQGAVLTEVEAAAAAAGGSIRVAVLDAEGRPLVAGPDSGTPTYTASLVKVLVVARLLALDAAGSVALGGEDLDRMQRAIVASDDDAMSVLWDRYDGAQLVRDAAATAGLTGTGPPAVPGQWGRTTTTAADVATFLASLGDILDDADATTLLGWMRSASGTAADGFDQRFGLLAPGNDGIAVKQGWMCCEGDRRQLHSAGVLGDGRVVVLLGDFPSATSYAAAATALDSGAAAVLRGISAAG